MKINIDDFRVRGGRKLNLKKWPTGGEPFYGSDKEARQLLEAEVERTSQLQDVLYADNSHSLLLIFQAMDAAGKDGAIKHVMSGVNPQGCQVSTFKQPSAEELDHDFMWRTTRHLPERGRIGIFNRSYYEEVLVVRVHPEFLQAQRLPRAVFNADTLWKDRYESIAEFEEHLHRNGTTVIKFFLHVSKDEQRKRFLERIDDAEKNWKFALGDVKERGFWDAYMEAYEDCMVATSTKRSPWYAVPADDKKNARLIISRVINSTLEGMDLEYPKLSKARLEELQTIRKLLE